MGQISSWAIEHCYIYSVHFAFLFQSAEYLKCVYPETAEYFVLRQSCSICTLQINSSVH